MMTQAAALVAALLAVAGGATSCPSSQDGTTGTGSGLGGINGAVVNATGFERNYAGDPGTHYAECTKTTGERYRVEVSAKQDYSLRNGDPCPQGLRLPMPDPALVKGLQKELEKPLPYEGGNPDSPCGAWGTVDKEEAKRFLAKCPPLTRGDLR